MQKLAGIYIPLTTPFSPDGEVSIDGLRANLAKYNATGLAGYVATGSTGESVLLSREEKLLIWDAVREAAAPGKTVIAGTAAESVRETISLTNQAAEMGYHAVLVRTPHYYKALMQRPASQVAFYHAVADAAKVPVIIYNFPQVTGIDLTVELVLQLAAHPNIAGVKDSSGNLEKLARIVDHKPAGFEVLVGAMPTYYASLCMGAAGGVLAFADIAPRAALAIHESFMAGDHAAARKAQRAIGEAATVGPRHGIPGIKYAMDRNGYRGGPVRPPLLEPSDADKAWIEEAFRNVTG